MAKENKSTLVAGLAACALVLTICAPASAEVPLVEQNGWQLSTDGRVNSFLSIGEGTGIPEGQPGDSLGAGTTDTQDSNGGLHSARLRNGFLMSILGFTGKKEVSPNFKVTTRIGLWMNVTGSRTKNNSAQADPRELWGEIAGNWGSFRGGSDLALFGRGGILVDSRIAHEYGLGYPCGVRDASGGACGMTGFGAPFPGYEPGMVYATPTLAGLQVSLALYDPATLGNAQLDRAPLPRFEGEAKYEYEEIVRVFGSGFWQVLEGTVPDTSPTAKGRQKNLHTDAWGAQGGAMLSLGPIMLGGAAYEGAGFSPVTYIDEGVVAADQAGVLRNSWGVFGLGAVSIDSLKLKIAGGAGVWHLNKNKDDSGATNNGVPTNPALIKQNFGATLGVYQTYGPVHFALEYFRAQHTWYDRGVPSAADPNVTASIVTPKQTVNFINAGTTITW